LATALLFDLDDDVALLGDRLAGWRVRAHLGDQRPGRPAEVELFLKISGDRLGGDAQVDVTRFAGLDYLVGNVGREQRGGSRSYVLCSGGVGAAVGPR